MKLIAQVKLQTGGGQFDAFKATLERANDAANRLSDYAWENKCFRQFDLHKARYLVTKNDFNLSAQMTIRTLSKVSDAYKVSKKTKRKFKRTGSIAYDSRILSWRMKDDTVSIWVLGGRVRVSFVCGPKQRALLEYRRGEADLVLCDGAFYLNQVCDIPEPPEFEPKEFMGVDLGITNIATTSTGKRYSGSTVKNNRRRNSNLRRKLQKKGSKSAKRLLKNRRKKEARFMRDVNHCISKELVSDAKRTGSAIVFEDLKGIRDRVRLRKRQRYIHGSWSFFQLQGFVLYKAKREGVPVVFVDPRNSSRECARCGHTEKGNRPNQATFSCKACGHTALADFNAAMNLSARGRALVNAPYADSRIYPAELQAPGL
jgi:putative transposase